MLWREYPEGWPLSYQMQQAEFQGGRPVPWCSGVNIRNGGPYAIRCSRLSSRFCVPVLLPEYPVGCALRYQMQQAEFQGGRPVPRCSSLNIQGVAHLGLLEQAREQAWDPLTNISFQRV